jgi:hypothetical protein
MLLFALNAMAQVKAFRAEVPRNTIAENEALQITFVIENMEDRNFSPPDFKGFNVVSGPMKGMSNMNINGVRSSSVTYVYLLQPQASGKLTIGAASIESGGKTVKSNTITITVNKAGTKPANSGGGGNNGGGNKGGGNNNGNGQDVNDYLDENLFIRLFVDKKEVYKGEQVTATYKLYRKVQVDQYSITQAPSFNGFWTVDIEEAKTIDFTVETFNGVQYYVAVVRKVALFPQRTGELEIDPMGLECTVVVPTGGWSYQRFQHKFSSGKAKIMVKPLPEANKPADFSGLVGELDMQVTLDKTNAKTDDPITLSIKFSGKGNLKFLENPTPELPNDFELFDPKTTEKSTLQGNVVGGSRQIDYLLIPRRAGTYKLPPITTSYFDLKKGTYVSLRSPEMVLSVEGESTVTKSVTSGINKEEVELLGQDIRYIQTDDPDLTTQGSFVMPLPVFALAFGAPILLFFGLIAVKRKRDKELGNTSLMKHRKAGKVAAKRLKQAEECMKANDKRGFYDELLKATWGYLSDKLGIPPSDMNKDAAINALRNRNVDAVQLTALAAMLDTAEMALYAPSTINESLQQTYDKATSIIDQLENSLS